MANTLTVRGFACAAPEVHQSPTGFVVGNFRMGSTHRRLDPVTNQWIDGETNWFRVNVFRALAKNVAISLSKGDRIIVVGKLRVVNYAKKDGSMGVSVEIDAESIGPDLQFGTASYFRTSSQAGKESTTPGLAPAGPKEVAATVASLAIGGNRDALPTTMTGDSPERITRDAVDADTSGYGGFSFDADAPGTVAGSESEFDSDSGTEGNDDEMADQEALHAKYIDVSTGEIVDSAGNDDANGIETEREQEVAVY